MEHRLGKRHQTQLSAIVIDRRAATWQGEIVNISAGGAYIRVAEQPVKLRGIVRLSFQLPEQHGECCEHRALIIHRSGDGIGVMFEGHQDVSFVRSATRGVPAEAAGVSIFG